jgi:hypothetical protein
MCPALSDLASTSYSFMLPSIGIKDQCCTVTSKHRRFIIILVITSSVTSVGQTPSVYAHHFHFHLAPSGLASHGLPWWSADTFKLPFMGAGFATDTSAFATA